MSRLDTMQSLFHGLANKLNNITTKAGSLPLMLAGAGGPVDYRSMSREQLVLEMEKILGELASIEGNAMEAGRLAGQLKQEIYAALKNHN